MNDAIQVDTVDRAIMVALQENGRLTIAELARRIDMSHSGAAERLRRLEQAGVIMGYRAVIDTERLGYPVMAFLRVRYPRSNYAPFYRLLEELPQVTEAHHVTGEDCFILKTLAVSMGDLERIAGRVAVFGDVVTNVVYSSPVPPRTLGPPPRT